MGKSTDIPATTVAQMVVLRDQGLTQRQIAARLHIKNQSTVQRCLKRHTDTNSFIAKKHGHRPCSTTRAADRHIQHIVAANPYISSVAVRQELGSTISVSARTIRRRLSTELGLKSYKTAAKPKLSAKNIADRIAFCNMYRHWTAADWHRVMFSDETTVSQYNYNQKYVRRPPGKRYDSKYVIGTVKFPAKTMIWGSIAASGRGSLWFAPPSSTINGRAYLSLLQEKLPTVMPLRECTTFQQDGAPCHRARIVTEWFSRQSFQLLQGWPGNSPDLNPIENCWTLIKQRLSGHRPTGTKDMIEKLKQIWAREISQEYCCRLVESMPHRIQAVLDAKGMHTKY